MARLALLVCGVLALAACGGDEGSSPKASGTATAQTDTSADRTKDSASPSAISGDGRYFGYVTGVKSEPLVILFDVAQTLSGEAAKRAAAEDGAVPPGQPVPNDHYERNPEQRSESLKLSSKAVVTAAPPASFLMQYVSRGARRKCEMSASAVPCTKIPLSLDRFFVAMEDLPQEQYGIPVWVTIRDGVVEKIDEQYFP